MKRKLTLTLLSLVLTVSFSLIYGYSCDWEPMKLGTKRGNCTGGGPEGPYCETEVVQWYNCTIIVDPDNGNQ